LTERPDAESAPAQRRLILTLLWAWVGLSSLLYLSQFGEEATAILQILGITG
jgi:hypothetical protein